MSNDKKRIIGRVFAEELAPADLDVVAGGQPWQGVKFTLYPTNGGSDDTQLTDSR